MAGDVDFLVVLALWAMVAILPLVHIGRACLKRWRYRRLKLKE